MKIKNYILKQTSGKPYIQEAYTKEIGMCSIQNETDAAFLLDTLLDMSHLAEEYLAMLCLDNQNTCIGVFEISHGIINSTFANPREVLIRALLSGASGIILAHNHVSGSVTPSSEDKTTSRRLQEACSLIGISLLDFLIIGKNHSAYSFYSAGLLTANQNSLAAEN